jgi:hypothetical protein
VDQSDPGGAWQRTANSAAGTAGQAAASTIRSSRVTHQHRLQRMVVVGIEHELDAGVEVLPFRATGKRPA